MKSHRKDFLTLPTALPPQLHLWQKAHQRRLHCFYNVCDGGIPRYLENEEYYHIEKPDYFGYPENDNDN